MITDKKLKEYIDISLAEEIIRSTENHILSILKLRQEHYPSDKHDKEWLDYSNLIANRRYKNEL